MNLFSCNICDIFSIWMQKSQDHIIIKFLKNNFTSIWPKTNITLLLLHIHAVIVLAFIRFCFVYPTSSSNITMRTPLIRRTIHTFHIKHHTTKSTSPTFYHDNITLLSQIPFITLLLITLSLES